MSKVISWHKYTIIDYRRDMFSVRGVTYVLEKYGYIQNRFGKTESRKAYTKEDKEKEEIVTKGKGRIQKVE